MLLFLLNLGFKFSNIFFFLTFRIGLLRLSMLLSIGLEPVDSEKNRIIGSFLDNIVDERFDKDVDLRTNILFDF